MISSAQADMVLLLVTLVCGGSNTAIRHHLQLDITVGESTEQQASEERVQSLVNSQNHSFTPPESHSIREKVRVGYS